MTSRALAWRTVTAHPGRALLAVAGVAVIGALLFDMLMLSRGLLITFRDLLGTGGYDVRVTGTDGITDLRQDVPHVTARIADLARLPEVGEVAAIRRTMADASVPGRTAEDVDVLSVTPGAQRQTWHVISGDSLSGPPAVAATRAIVVSRSLADRLGLAPGATINLSPTASDSQSAFPARPYRVVGIVAFVFAGADDLTAATMFDPAGPLEADGDRDTADLLVVRSRSPFGPGDAAAAIMRLRPDLRAKTNAQVVEQFDRSSFAYFRQISFVLSSITLAFAFLLVATLLTVSVNQQLSDMAALRALGFPRRRIVFTLLWESAWLVGVGGLIALPLGGLLAVQFDRILRAMPGLPSEVHFFVLEPRAVALLVALLGVAGLAATAYPLWIAMRLPIAATLRREGVS